MFLVAYFGKIILIFQLISPIRGFCRWDWRSDFVDTIRVVGHVLDAEVVERPEIVVADEFFPFDLDTEFVEGERDLCQGLVCWCNGEDFDVAAPGHEFLNFDHAFDLKGLLCQVVPVDDACRADDLDFEWVAGPLVIDEWRIPLDNALLFQSVNAIPDSRIGDADLLSNLDGSKVSRVTLQHLEDTPVNVVKRGMLRPSAHGYPSG